MRAMLIALLFAGPAIAEPAFDEAVLAELNRARTDPQSFADDLTAFRQTFDTRGYYRNLSDGRLWASNEGAAAVDEAIAFLRSMPARPALAPSSLLAVAAADHTAEQGPHGGFGHRSRSGAWPSDRLEARGGGVYVAEAISYGMGDARDVIIQLIVDDGVPDRGHRTILLDPDYNHAGAGCGPHRAHQMMCTIELSVSADGK